MEGMAFDVEGCHAGGCCYTHTMVKEKSQAVNQIRLSRPSCSGDYQSQRLWMVRLGMLSNDVVGLQLLPLKVLRVSGGGEQVLTSRLMVPRDEGGHLLDVGIPLCSHRPVLVLRLGTWLQVCVAAADKHPFFYSSGRSLAGLLITWFLK